MSEEEDITFLVGMSLVRGTRPCLNLCWGSKRDRIWTAEWDS